MTLTLMNYYSASRETEKEWRVSGWANERVSVWACELCIQIYTLRIRTMSPGQSQVEAACQQCLPASLPRLPNRNHSSCCTATATTMRTCCPVAVVILADHFPLILPPTHTHSPWHRYGVDIHFGCADIVNVMCVSHTLFLSLSLSPFLPSLPLSLLFNFCWSSTQLSVAKSPTEPLVIHQCAFEPALCLGRDKVGERFLSGNSNLPQITGEIFS